jgi:hypothetical protein
VPPAHRVARVLVAALLVVAGAAGAAAIGGSTVPDRLYDTGRVVTDEARRLWDEAYS